MKKPAQVLFAKSQFGSISEIEQRLARIVEMQRLLAEDKPSPSPASAEPPEDGF